MENWFSIFQKLNSIQKTDLEIRNFKVKNKHDIVVKSISTYNNNFELLVQDAADQILQYADLQWFCSDEKYISIGESPIWPF